MASAAGAVSRVEALAEVYEKISSVVGALDEADFNRPTGCDAWSVQDLLFHLLLDAQRALITLADPKNSATDTDAVSYWSEDPGTPTASTTSPTSGT